MKCKAHSHLDIVVIVVVAFVFADGDDAIEVNESFTDEPDTDGNKPNSEWPLFDHVRSQDIRLLKTLNVGTIVDFMVEKKKVKFGLK